MPEQKSQLSPLPDALVQAWLASLVRIEGKTLRAGDEKGWVEHLAERHLERLRDLWRAYNTHRAEIGQLPLTTAAMASAYALGFHLNNAQRVLHILRRGPVASRSPQLVFDLGCGSGAAAAAFAVHAPAEAPLQFELWDASAHLLTLAETSLHRLRPEATVRTFHGRFGDPGALALLDKKLRQARREGRQVVMLLSYVLNEVMARPRAQAFFDRAFDFCQREGVPLTLIIAEPGREREARQAMEFREALVQNGFRSLYPCPTSGACPLLRTHPKDWCFSEVPDHGTDLWRPVARGLQLQRQRLAVAGYVFQLHGTDPERGQPVVVGHPLEADHEIALTCDGRGISRRPEGTSALRGEVFQPRRGSVSATKGRSR